MAKKLNTQVPCPTCNKRITWGPDSPYRPFCSERCRLIDLGEWLNESHRISEPAGDSTDQSSELN